MPRALISVSQDGYTYLSLDGATSRYSDTGQAMTYLGDYVRATETPVSVTIDNGDQGVDVVRGLGAGHAELRGQAGLPRGVERGREPLERCGGGGDDGVRLRCQVRQEGLGEPVEVPQGDLRLGTVRVAALAVDGGETRGAVEALGGLHREAPALEVADGVVAGAPDDVGLPRDAAARARSHRGALGPARV